MAFTKVNTQTYYPNLKASKAGDKLVDNGIYTGSKQGQFGLTHMFDQKDGKTVGISGKTLDYLVDEAGKILAGKAYNVYYDGQGVVEKGPLAGKPFHKFALEVDDAPAITVAGKNAKPTIDGPVDTSDISI